ncbi:MAG: trehalose-phosphatase [Candidatus Omnitrophica bacterium]|nr:trehalose-phosphatase [Candidatus Omnitrophota bacterium]
MKHLLGHWEEFKEKLHNKHRMLFLDYDGTLTPIVDKPQRALLSRKTKQLLSDLTQQKDYTIVVITGRALKDIKRLVGIKGITYVGNHGFEIEGPQIRFRSPVYAGFRKILRKLKPEILEKVSRFKGVLLEDKGFSLSLHYRRAKRSLIPEIKTAFEGSVMTYVLTHKVKTSSGKMVMEIRPPVSWDKGKAVLWLFARQKFSSKAASLLPLYIGDDVTDEDAFQAVRNKGIGVHVGLPKKSYAQFYLRGTKEVARLFEELLRLEGGKTRCRN